MSNPNVYFPPESNTAERVHLLLGDVPYPAIVFSPAPDGYASGVEEAVILEKIKGDVTSDNATSGFEAGTVFPCSWSGERHPTDGRRLMRHCDAATGDQID